MKHLALLLCLILLPLQGHAEGTPRVVASIGPVKSLVDHILGGWHETGVAETGLVLPPGASPHSFALRPSAAHMLAKADVVFWVGPGLETFLQKPLAALSADARRVALIEAPGLHLLPARTEHSHGKHEDEHEEDHEGEEERPDPHIWLSPANAAQMAVHIARVMSEVDPDRAAQYQANLERLQRELAQLHREIVGRIAPVRQHAFLTYHDGFQYLENAYGLKSVGIVAQNPEVPPGAQHLGELQHIIRDQQVRCLFVEPQFRGKSARQLASASGIGLATLDPLDAGERWNDGKSYFTLMGAISDTLRDCLSGPK